MPRACWSASMPTRRTHLDLGSLRIDVQNRLLLDDGERVALTPKAFDTLWALIERRGEVVSKEDLIATVWPETFVSEATLTQNIHTVRKVLAAAGSEGVTQTVPRRGYRFSGSVSEAVEASSRSRQRGPRAPRRTTCPTRESARSRSCPWFRWVETKTSCSWAWDWPMRSSPVSATFTGTTASGRSGAGTETMLRRTGVYGQTTGGRGARSNHGVHSMPSATP